MVDAVHVTRAGADQFRDRHAGAEAELEDLVGGVHIEQRDHPAVALPVGRAVGEHPAGHAPGRAGVTASALRYYEELGLLPPPARISGQRRYPESADRLVAAILLYSDAGFTLAEQKALLDTRASPPGDRR